MIYFFKIKISVLVILFSLCCKSMIAIDFPSEKYRHGIDFNKIDSIVIMTIDPMSVGFGPIIYDRTHFEDTFNYFIDPIHSTEVYKFVITESKDKMFIATAMSYFKPYEKDRIKIYPNDVKINEGIDWHQSLHSKWQTNDPIETRTRIQFYMKDGDVVTAFASPTSFDIFNYRYASPQFSKILQNYLWYFSDEAVINNSKRILENNLRETEL